MILSAPAKDADLTVVVGVIDGEYDPLRHDVISAASCTTNCVAPMAKVLNGSFGLERGIITTVHAYTGDQMLLDGPHHDPRRGRSAAVNIVPTTTGAARATGAVITRLAARLDGVAVRVPVEDGSLTDLTAVLGEDVTVSDITTPSGGPRCAVRWPASAVHEGPARVSCIIGDPASCVFDSRLTQAAGTLVKIFGWYDNDWGYTG